MIEPCWQVTLDILSQRSSEDLELDEDGRSRIGSLGGFALIIPVRCFTCGRVIGDKWEEFSRRVKEGEKPNHVLDDLGFKRYCCRRMFISHVEIIDGFLKFAELSSKKRNKIV